MNQIRNIAVSGVDTVEKYINVVMICEGVKPPKGSIDDFVSNLKRQQLNYVFDNGDDCDFMHNRFWEDRCCTKYTYEEFMEKFSLKTDETNKDPDEDPEDPEDPEVEVITAYKYNGKLYDSIELVRKAKHDENLKAIQDAFCQYYDHRDYEIIGRFVIDKDDLLTVLENCDIEDIKEAVRKL